MRGKLRRFLSGVTVVSMLLMLLVPMQVVGATTASFPDLEGHWAAGEINKWDSWGLVGGYPDGTFGPSRLMTRAEFITYVNRAFGYTKLAEIDFADVDSSHWYYGDVAKGIAMGYVTGNEDGTFRPNEPISRLEAAGILYKVLRLEPVAEDYLTEYTDVASLSEAERETVNAIVAGRYFGGYGDGTLRMQSTISRAEMIVILARAAGEIMNVADAAFGPEEGIQTINGNATINKAGIALQNTVVKGDLYITEGVGEGDFYLHNVTVEGRTIVAGGGSHSGHVTGTSQLAHVIITYPDGSTHVVFADDASVGAVEFRSPGSVDTSGSSNDHRPSVNISAAVPPGSTITIVGDFEDIVVDAPDVSINIAEGSSASSVNVSENAVGSSVNVGGQVEQLQTSAPINVSIVSGGSLDSVHIDEKADGTAIEKDEDVAAPKVEASEDADWSKNWDDQPSTPPPSDDDDEPTWVSVTGVNVEGVAVVGATMTASPTPSGARVNYQWQRADAVDGTYVDIAEATGRTYALVAEDLGKYIQVRVRGTGSYQGTVTSEPCGPVELDIPVVFYTGKDFNRSFAPIVDGNGNVVQAINDDGSIKITVENTGYIDSGFVMEPGTLGELGNIAVEGEGHYGLNLYFDLNKDGEFFNWDGNEYLSVGEDAYALCHGTIEDGVLTVTDSTKFNLMSGGGMHTLSELKARFGVDTTIGIWVGVTSPDGTGKTATISSIAIEEPATTDIPVVFYTGKDFNRSFSPIVDSSGNVVQAINADGSITIQVSGDSKIESGFVMEVGEVGRLSSITLEGTGDYYLNLYFDVNGDGEFFEWNEDGTFKAVGADKWAADGAPSSDGTLVVNDASVFESRTDGKDYTVSELKAMYDPNTLVGIWIGVDSTDTTVTISSVTVDQVAFPVTNTTQNRGYNTIQDAITAAVDGDVLQVSAGTHNERIIIGKQLTLIGAGNGEDGTIINCGIEVRANNVNIENMQVAVVDRVVHAVSGIEGGNAIYVDATGVVIDNVSFDGSGVTDATSRAIIGHTGSGYTVTDSYFVNVTTGIFAHSGGSSATEAVALTATGNSFENVLAGIGGTWKTYLDAEGNTFVSIQPDGEGIAVADGTIVAGADYGYEVDYLVEHNTFNYTAAYQVKDYRSPVYNVSSGQKHTTIQEAIVEAQDHDTILVAGTHELTQSLNIGKPLSLVGIGEEPAIIDAKHSESYTFPLGNNAQLRVQNITFKGNGKIGFRASSQTHVVRLDFLNCTFEDFSYPIYLSERTLLNGAVEGDNKIDDLSIIGCTFDNNQHVYLGRGVVNSAQVLGNTFTGDSQIGIEFYDCWSQRRTGNISFQDNSFSNEYPIVLLTGGSVTIDGTNVTYAEVPGGRINVVYVKAATVENERVSISNTQVNGVIRDLELFEVPGHNGDTVIHCYLLPDED